MGERERETKDRRGLLFYPSFSASLFFCCAGTNQVTQVRRTKELKQQQQQHWQRQRWRVCASGSGSSSSSSALELHLCYDYYYSHSIIVRYEVRLRRLFFSAWPTGSGDPNHEPNFDLREKRGEMNRSCLPLPANTCRTSAPVCAILEKEE